MLRALSLLPFLLFALSATLPRDAAQISSSKMTYNPSATKATTCTCDITANLCDPQCCCDFSCSSSQRSVWKAMRVCLNERQGKSTKIPSCSEVSSQIQDLTSGLRYLIKILHGLLCVQYSQSSDSDYISSPPAPSLAASKKAVSSPSSSPVSSSPIYSATSSSQKPFSLPRAVSPRGSCFDSPLQMYSSLPTKTCYVTLTPSEFQTACATSQQLAPNYYYEGVSLFTSDPSKTVAVSLNSTWVINSNEELSLLSSTPNIVYSSASSLSCGYHVSALTYTLQPSSSAVDTLDKVLLDITLRQSSSFASSSTSIQVPIASTLTVSSPANPQGLTNNGGLGYSFGQALNIGSAFTSSGKTAIIQSKQNALMFSDPSTGLCYTSTPSKQSPGQQLLFGQNAMLSCSSSYTLAELKSVCSSSIYSNSMLVNLQAQLQYLGIFRKSNQDYLSDWLKVQDTISTELNGLQGVFSDNACKFKFARVQIYYSKIGSEHAFQYRLNYAQIVLRDQYFTYTLADTSQKQQFNYQLLVNFLSLPQTLDYYIAALPSSNFYTPNDVLYPFYVASASSLQYALSTLLLLLFLSY